MTRTLLAGCFAAALALAPLAPIAAAPASETHGAMLAASDGHGTIFLAWFPAVGGYPAGGWRLSEVTSSGERVIRARVAPADSHLYDELRGRSGTRAEVNAYAILGMRAFTDPVFAQAAALATTLQGVARGAHRYRVTPLDASGRPSGAPLTSVSVDASIATPLPPAPGGLHAESVRGGVTLFWQPSRSSRDDPVFSYRIERGGGGSNALEITQKPLVISLTARASLPRYVDAAAPVGHALTYRVYAVDLFGRRGNPATVKLFAGDVSALDPPGRFAAHAGRGDVSLSWTPRQDVNTAGYIIERASQITGPYTPLQTTALGPKDGSYVDRNVRPGSLYYYRLLAVSPQGKLGPPSLAAFAQPQGASKPATVGGLHADSGTTRVRLTWHRAAGPVAGYFVQRKVGNENRWTTLTAKVSPVPRYDDTDVHGTLTIAYRIVTVGFDNQESAPSAPVTVVRVDRTPPAPPRIRRIESDGGNVVIDFSPAGGRTHLREFVIARGANARDAGVVVGRPLPASARRFTDPTVHAGSTYYYRVYAIDARGIRSDSSQRVAIRVASAALPQPPAPAASFDAKPYPSVTLHFSQPGKGIAVLVFRRTASNKPWVRIAGPVPSAKAISDLHPPAHATVAYRIVYVAPDRRRSEPSAASSVRIP